VVDNIREPWWRQFRHKVVAALLFLVLLVVLDSPGFSARLRHITGDAMDWRSRYLAGFSSTSCGRVMVGQDPNKATECALKAYSESRAFRVTYDVQVQGSDSVGAWGIVGRKDGQLLDLSFVGCPSGCGFSMTQQHVTVSPSPRPYHFYADPRGRVSCFQAPLSNSLDVAPPHRKPH